MFLVYLCSLPSYKKKSRVTKYYNNAIDLVLILLNIISINKCCLPPRTDVIFLLKFVKNNWNLKTCFILKVRRKWCVVILRTVTEESVVGDRDCSDTQTHAVKSSSGTNGWLWGKLTYGSRTFTSNINQQFIWTKRCTPGFYCRPASEWAYVTH